MTGEDTIKHFRCKIKQFSFAFHNMQDPYILNKLATNFKEPVMAQFLTNNLHFKYFNLQQCNLQKRDLEYLCRALNPNEGPSIQTQLQKLNLSRNNFGKEGIKLLSNGLESNTNLLHLDISGNQIGVSGTKAIASLLQKNNILQTLNLFSNKIDVDGARALGEALQKNKSLIFLDIGSNRIRDKGIQAIGEGIKANQSTSLVKLGIRWNFISDEGLQNFLKSILQNQVLKIKQLYCKKNNLTEPGLDKFQKLLQEKNCIMYIDVFSKLKYLRSETLEKSVWISPGHNLNQNQITKFFENDSKCGTVISCRLRTGLVQEKKPLKNKFIFVEFGHINSVTRALHLASKKKTEIEGNKFRIYKAGTSTKIYQNKIKSKQNAKQNPNNKFGAFIKQRSRFGKSTPF